MTANLDNLGRGNSETLPPKRKNRKFCFTLNNYTDERLAQLKNEKFYKYIIFGKEIAPSTGTPHLQGYFELEHPRYIKGLMEKDCKGMHLTVANGTAEQNKVYCSKGIDIFEWGTPLKGHGGKRTEKISAIERAKKELMESRYNNVNWRPWQQAILDKIKEEPNDREINWIIDYKGNNGKSFLATYIVATMEGVIICDGKKDNIFNQVNEMMTKQDKIPKIILLDIPRQLEGKIHYGTLEALKNGCLYSGKYEGGVCVFKPPHVFAFANFDPDTTAMSTDRWNIEELEEI